jgi:GT2 family glycosyltransferase
MCSPSNPMISIVIVSWNAKTFLAECLESLQGSVYDGQMEITVVDNASSDGSVEMVRALFPAVNLICNDGNLGFAKANNIGIRIAKGEYIALINSDVHVLAGCLSKLVSYCERHPLTGLVGPYIKGGDSMQQISCRAAPTLWNTFCRAVAVDAVFPRSRLFNGYFLGHRDHGAVGPVDILSGCFWLARRAALDEVGLLDEAFFIYGEDMDWCKRVRDAGWGVEFVPHAKAIHYGGASSANAPIRFYIERQKADLQYWRKHHSSLSVLAYYAIAVLNHFLRVVGYSAKACVPRGDKASARYKARRSAACLRWLLTVEPAPHRSSREEPVA